MSKIDTTSHNSRTSLHLSTGDEFARAHLSNEKPTATTSPIFNFTPKQVVECLSVIALITVTGLLGRRALIETQHCFARLMPQLKLATNKADQCHPQSLMMNGDDLFKQGGGHIKARELTNLGRASGDKVQIRENTVKLTKIVIQRQIQEKQTMLDAINLEITGHNNTITRINRASLLLQTKQTPKPVEHPDVKEFFFKIKNGTLDVGKRLKTLNDLIEEKQAPARKLGGEIKTLREDLAKMQ